MRVFLMVAIILLSGAAFGADDVKLKQGEKILSTEGGRFAFGQISDARRDQYMLDTKTGRLWRIVSAKYRNEKGEEMPGDGFPILEQILYEDVKGVRSVDPK